MNISNDRRLAPISVRVPKKLRDDLFRIAAKNRRSLSSYCRILIEDNYKNFGRNHSYHTLKYKDDNLVLLSITMSIKEKKQIYSYIASFHRKYYNEVSFSAFIRKILSDSEKD